LVTWRLRGAGEQVVGVAAEVLTEGVGAAMGASITATGLTRRFGPVTAVDSVDLSVSAGTVYGFLGRNGAGKTTLIRLLLGLIRPSAGRVCLLGRPVDSRGGSSGPWAEVGYLVEGPGLYPELSPRDHLRLARTYRGVSAAACDEVVERLDLGRYLDVRSHALSQGNRQRLGLAMALVHRPRVLVLDEPTVGMDPAGMVEIRALLRGLADAGATVFMSTHLVSEVERIADEIGIIHEGRILDHLSRARLASVGRPRLVVELASPTLAQQARQALRATGTAATVTGVTLTMVDDRVIARPEEVARVLVSADCPPRALRIETDSLEAHFLVVTGAGR
jgi:ABC-2 type transport system ATP-binding protein